MYVGGGFMLEYFSVVIKAGKNTSKENKIDVYV